MSDTNKDFAGALAELEKSISTKTASQLDEKFSKFQEEYKGEIADSAKEIKDIIETQKKEAEEQAKNLNILSAKFNEVKSEKLPAKTMSQLIVKGLKDEFDGIKGVQGGGRHSFEVKAVADMTLGNNLTGAGLETYQPGVAANPAQPLNFDQLVPTVNSATGIYVVYRENAAGGEGSISAKTEGAAASQIDFDYTKVTFNASYIAGFTRFSNEMTQDLPFLTSHLPFALRREYYKVENSTFNTSLSGAATASALTSGNEIERLLENVSVLEGGANSFGANGMVITPADWFKIAVTEKSTGAGYGLPGVVSIVNGQISVNGIPVFKANWLAANKYYVGDWSQAKKVSVDGLRLEFFEQDSDNATKLLTTARIAQRTVLGIDRPDAFIFGDFTTTV